MNPMPRKRKGMIQTITSDVTSGSQSTMSTPRGGMIGGIIDKITTQLGVTPNMRGPKV